MELYLTGQISKDKVYDYITNWHMGQENDPSLPQWLGMSEKMYCMFVEIPKEFFERYTPNPPTLRDKR
jgi:hypothetical protein